MMSFHQKSYIGDGVYVIREDFGDLTLTTEDGVRTTNAIILEPDVWTNLKDYAEHTEKERKAEFERQRKEES
jgi:hypothetical protein